MTTIEAIKSALPLEAVLGDAGVELRHGKALCPFHGDKHPSLSIKGGRWKCWSCGEGGDVIDFVAKLHGLDTKGALRLLADRAGIEPASIQAERLAAERARREREKRQELIDTFREWEQETVNEIAAVLRAYRRLMVTRTDFSERELQVLAGLKVKIDYLEYCYEILCSRDDESKFRLYKEMSLEQ